ncbi:MAG: deoxyguanosinetriphosphate triphosphohydrolase [Nitrospinota bacterium]|nr:deoxyguanosinetriphosphate triphosphohydrolase [Nitrospinota bacterium]
MIKRTDIEKLEQTFLAPYAVKSGEGAGRKNFEEEHVNRTRFQRDRDRVVHTSAFRRLEYKTQVFVYHEGDYYRTRLTHSLEVAQIARSISKSLQLNEDLTEAVALAHDLGHPPFGHTGQKVLNTLMQGHGGFEHNRQSLRIVTLLEKRYPEFDGLNLTWEVLEGISKHQKDPDNPISQTKDFRFPSLEAQIADCADGIAYNAHDLDDGITSGLLNFDDLCKVTLWSEIVKKLDQQYANLDRKMKKYLIVRNVINTLVTDFCNHVTQNIKTQGIKSVADGRACEKKICGFSAEIEDKLVELRRFLFKNMYNHHHVRRMEFKAEMYLQRLFEAYSRKQELLPESVLANPRQDPKERLICDYISGMTDRFAISEFKKLFSAEG